MRLMLLALMFVSALAQPAAAEPPEYDDSAPADPPRFGRPDPGWSADPGIAVRARPTHLGARQYTIDALPIIEIHYGDQIQFSLDDGAKYALFHGQVWAIGPVAEYRQSFTDKLPRGARDVDDAIELGGFASYQLPFGDLEGRLRRAVTGYRGWSGDLSFDTGIQIGPRWKIGGEARLAWADTRFTNDYFGLKSFAARREGLPRFLENDFRTAGVQLGATYQLSRHVQFITSLSDDRIIGPIGHTPLLQSRDLGTFTLGVTYHWSAR